MRWQWFILAWRRFLCNSRVPRQQSQLTRSEIQWQAVLWGEQVRGKTHRGIMRRSCRIHDCCLIKEMRRHIWWLEVEHLNRGLENRKGHSLPTKISKSRAKREEFGVLASWRARGSQLRDGHACAGTKQCISHLALLAVPFVDADEVSTQGFLLSIAKPL